MTTPPWIPRSMRVPPRLKDVRVGAPCPRYALLINPFYAKDPHASFGKHVLTPSLALTSIAAAAPPTWQVRYWDERPQGPAQPPQIFRPGTQVVVGEDEVRLIVRIDLGDHLVHISALVRLVQAARGQIAEPALEKIWSAAVSIDVTDDPSLVREMALAGCTGVFVGFESLDDRNLADARKRTPRTEDYARRVRILHDCGIQVNGSFVLGFDHDGPDVFARTVDWIERQRLECATFHILTPYPGTPLFAQMESDGRLLHRDWDQYDTSHAVFRPRHMTPRELEAGYAWCYQRLFSPGGIWARRPADWRAVLPYLAMAYLYKRSNHLWHRLIRHEWTAAVWRPLVAATRFRHLRFRRRLAELPHATDQVARHLPSIVPAGA